MKVKRKFKLLFWTIALIILMLIGYTIYAINFFNTANHNIHNINNIQNDIFLLHILQEEYLKSGSDRSLMQCDILEKKIDNYLKSTYFLKYQDPYILQLTEDITYINEIFHKLSGGKALTTKQIQFLESRARVKFHSCSSILQNLRTQTTKQVSKTLKSILTIYLSVIALLIAAIFTIYRFTGNSMLQPLYNIIDQINMVGKGNLNHQIKYEKHDEFNDLVVAFNNMTNTLKQFYISIDSLNNEVEKRKASEIKLMESNKNLESFASVLSHDLKSPLSAVITLMDILSQDLPNLSDSRLRLFKMIKDKALMMCEIVDDLFAFSSIKAIESEKTKVDLNIALQKAIGNLNTEIKKSKAKIKTSDMPIILGYQVQFIRLFQNIISNAIKYCDKNIPVITIKCTKLDKAILLSIKDNGIGIEKELQKEVFLMFTQINKNIEGSGIGLAAVKKIADNHNGQVWLESEPGAGTCVFIKIPY